MSTRNRWPHTALGLGLLAAVALPAWAFSPYQDELTQRYHHHFNCEVCHEGPHLNQFGKDFQFALRLEGGDPQKALASIEMLDSDGDGWSNGDELRAGTYPGNKTSFPSGSPPPLDTPSPSPAASPAASASPSHS